MRPLIHEVRNGPAPETLAAFLHSAPGFIWLDSALSKPPHGRYSFLTAYPFALLFSKDARVTTLTRGTVQTQFGNLWRILEQTMARYELLDEIDLPFPLGGCFGLWGYELRHFVESRLGRHGVDDLELPDCHLGFYDSLVAFDHQLDKTWIIASGLHPDGSRSAPAAQAQLDRWHRLLEGALSPAVALSVPLQDHTHWTASTPTAAPPLHSLPPDPDPFALPPAFAPDSSHQREQFLAAVRRALRYIQAGDIYQVNLSHRLQLPAAHSAWRQYQRLRAVSPAPFGGFYNASAFQLLCSSPELFMRLSGRHVLTRPIKGTRPRSTDPVRDAQLSYELQTSAKEQSELVMITDLLRNDLGRICEFGSIQVPELLHLEHYPHVHHLMSTVQGLLRPDLTHTSALFHCFPGGSVTGAPKVRAMEIIDELEPVTRGPYTGCLGYLGFNQESQFNIIIRSAIASRRRRYLHVGAGIVADSDPLHEYAETMAKAAGPLQALLPPLPAPGSTPARPTT